MKTYVNYFPQYLTYVNIKAGHYVWQTVYLSPIPVTEILVCCENWISYCYLDALYLRC